MDRFQLHNPAQQSEYSIDLNKMARPRAARASSAFEYGLIFDVTDRLRLRYSFIKFYEKNVKASYHYRFKT